MALVIAGIDLLPVSLLALSSCWIEQAMTLTKPLGSLYTASTCLTICRFSIAKCLILFSISMLSSLTGNTTEAVNFASYNYCKLKYLNRNPLQDVILTIQLQWVLLRALENVLTQLKKLSTPLVPAAVVLDLKLVVVAYIVSLKAR